ncbi:DUF4249 family protein [Fulvivirgaceae bacterium PWU4]|uniref:DUF4249 family protein n=1 Tax=Chryseosolibacter histidini TaxID=2782349 RepID=A0AAP2DPP2_9BACT|nr:DUF4249 domain-containing protein [Chryseosolibacter histidini]MBT1700260.1 DUF4249 family protein [Chryseosolibacter histidini]
MGTKVLRIAIPMLMVLIDGCIEPLEIAAVSNLNKLVVDGMVTNEPGPYTVKISHTVSTDALSSDAVPVTDAKVSIVEDGTIVRDLYQAGGGVYQTYNNWQAQVGKTYAVRIITSTQKEYRSEPQVLTDAGSIDNIYTEFEDDAIVYQSDGSEKQDAINVSVDAKAATTSTGHLRWRFKGTFHARTYPELRYYETLNDERIPDPLPCSGHINYFDELLKIGDCTCCECWPTEYNNSILLSNTQFTQHAEYKNVLLHKIPVTSVRMINLYHVEIEQLSLSTEVYNFWKLVKTLQESSGSIFQPSAVKVRGNIVTADGKSDEVLGIFAVCGITRKSVFIDRALIPYAFTPETGNVNACKAIFPNATDKPAYWP